MTRQQMPPDNLPLVVDMSNQPQAIAEGAAVMAMQVTALQVAVRTYGDDTAALLVEPLLDMVENHVRSGRRND